MDIVFGTRHASFLHDESYPPIDQAGDVDRYDDPDDNHLAASMENVGDVSELGVAVSYHPPEASILAESEPSRLGVDEVMGGDEHHEHHRQSDAADVATASAVSAAAVAATAAEAVAVAAAAEEAVRHQHQHQHHNDSSNTISNANHSDGASPAPLKETSPLLGAGSGSLSGRVKPIPRPDRDAKKNDMGLFQCTWANCVEDMKQFARRCEFNKHMDKHERPYRCLVEACAKLPGFTYSGGLLRHEREVHGKHGGPRNPLHCPHPTCKRHSGKGFSRQENLNEHLRRVHTPTLAGMPSTAVTTATTMAGGPGGSGGGGGDVMAHLNELRPLAAFLPSSPTSGSAAAAAAAAVSVAAVDLYGDEAKVMAEGLDMYLPGRRRKRTASYLEGGDGVGSVGSLVEAGEPGEDAAGVDVGVDVVGGGGGVGDDGHGENGEGGVGVGGGDSLRDEVKRVRLENEALKRKVEFMMMQIEQLQKDAQQKQPLLPQLQLQLQQEQEQQQEQHQLQQLQQEPEPEQQEPPQEQPQRHQKEQQSAIAA